MNFKIEPKFTCTGQYDIVKKNIKTGDITEHSQCNVLTDQFMRCLKRSYGSSGSIQQNYLSYIHFGSGTGEVSSADYALFNYLWAVSAKVVSFGYVNNDYKTFRVTMQATLPPDTNYVGTITELGLANYYTEITKRADDEALFSHALLKDAEGNPISIEKTELDEIIVNYTLTVSFSELDTSVFKLASYRLLFSSLNTRYAASYGIVRRSYDNNTDPFINDKSLTFYNSIVLSSIKHMQLYNGRRIFKRFYSRNSYSANSGTLATLDQRGKLDEASMCVVMDSTRLAASVLNNRYLHSICINKLHEDNEYTANSQINLVAYLFNNELFAPTELSNMQVGTGDGSTTNFKPPLNFWVKDTDKIYIDGVLQVKGVDYTCDYFNNIDLLFELYPSTDAIIVSGHEKLTTGSDSANILSSEGITFCAKNNCEFSKYSYAADDVIAQYEVTGIEECKYITRYYNLCKDNPVVIYLPIDEDTNKDYSIDMISFFTNTVIATNIINIEVSNDNVDYTPVAENIKISDHIVGNGFNNSFKYILNEPVLAKYWRITAVSSQYDSGYIDIENLLMRRTGRPIVFTNPPAAGAKITMDATIDRPFKNDKHVIDVSGVYQF